MTAPSMSAEIVKALAADRRATHAVVDAAVDQLAHHPGQVAELLRGRVQLSEAGYVTSNVPALVDELRKASPHMFRDQHEGRQDADQAKSTPAPESREALAQLFGKDSSCKRANELGRTNPRRYAELREAAIRIGLI